MLLPGLRPNEIRTWRRPINELIADQRYPGPHLLELETVGDDGERYTRSVLVEKYALADDPEYGGETRVRVEFVHHEFEPRSFAPDEEVTVHTILAVSP